MSDSSGIRSALSDISEKRHICQMCQTKTCPRDKRGAFQKNFREKSCPDFTYPRFARGDMITSWERRHET